MISISANRDNINAIIFGLAMECPLDGGNPDDCKFYQLRKLSVKERWKYVRTMSLEEKFRAYHRHKECYNKKLKELIS